MLSTDSSLPGIHSTTFIISEISSHFIHREINTPIAANIFWILKSHFNLVSILISGHATLTENLVKVISLFISFATRLTDDQIQ
ncbi:hypothetical protein HOF65_05540 [bacterium]|jgi:hypothetical protein|nr:hypothetical protein [bacterium]MBT3853407.1 hypothetical protein [bacterium]MBT4633150.1 hypothetical protein [bacterium]MBT5491871.1 hypothetical protein [bacterium]MBT6778909.1 hypothetical protein [bacterium]